MNRRHYILLEQGAWVAGIVAVLLLFTALIVWPDLRGMFNDNQGTISVLLTAMLVLLYLGQYRVQSRQLRFEHSSHVQVQQKEVEDNKIDVWLSNAGNGPATDLQLETCIDFPASEGFDPECESVKIRRVGEEGDYKKRVGNILQSGEHHIHFQGEPRIKMELDDKNHRTGLFLGTRKLAERGIESVELRFYITNEDLLGNTYREKLVDLHTIVELEDEGIELQDVKTGGVLLYE